MLTKREWFAGMALGGLLSDGWGERAEDVFNRYRLRRTA